MPSCVCRSGWVPGCDVQPERFGQSGDYWAGAEPASRESENRHFFRDPGRGGLDEGVSGESENRLLPPGLDDGVSGESEISAETSFVHSVGSVFRV